LKPFDSNGNFHPFAEGDGLRRAAVRGAGVMIFAEGASFAVQMGSTLVLARLLTPNDFGVVTMVTTFSLLFYSVGLNGFTELILQRDELHDSLASNLFWINIGIGALLTVGFAALGPLLSLFYHDATVRHVTEGMSLTIIAGSFSVIHLALLKRAMRFTSVSANRVFARVFSFVLAIVLAMMGFGYWALVAGYISQELMMSIGAWYLCRWAPSLPRRTPGTGAAVKFAANVFLHFGFSYSSGNTDNLLVGWRFGASSLGFYKKAFDIFYLPANQLLSPMSSVAIATLSRFNRDRAQYQRYFLLGVSVLAFLGMGIGADLTLVGRDLIRVLLGPNWTETGRIFAFFGPGIGVMLLCNTHGWIHLSIGRPDRWFRWGVIEFFCTVGLFVIGLHWGPEGVALAWTTSYFLLMFPAFWYAGAPVNFGVGPILAVVWKFFVASIVAGGSAIWIVHTLGGVTDAPGVVGALARLVSMSLLFFALYLAAVIALHRGFEPIRQAMRLIENMRPQRSTGQAVAANPSASARSQVSPSDGTPEPNCP
jgi:O-antigen/teichoic acid export membrane protein